MVSFIYFFFSTFFLSFQMFLKRQWTQFVAQFNAILFFDTIDEGLENIWNQLLIKFLYANLSSVLVLWYVKTGTLQSSTQDAAQVSLFIWKFTLPFKKVQYRVFFFYQSILRLTALFYLFFKSVLIVFFIGLLLLIYTVYFFKLNFLKQLGVWFVVGFFFFWLMSGFNFFLKRYRFGKFTSAIQRFWKRTNMCFWLIEGFLFLIFFYYYTNSSQEPTYFYDYASYNNDFLFSLPAYYFNALFLIIIIFLLYYLLLNLLGFSYSVVLFWTSTISIIVFYIFFIETYQFYYVLTAFKEITWVFSVEEGTWVYDVEAPRLRVKHQYLLMCLIAKYWHFLFIFISWVFFLMKSFEMQRVTYTLLAVNLQNFIILYMLNILFIAGWVKWLVRRYGDIVYFWFFINTNLKYTLAYTQELSWFFTVLFKA